MTAIDFDGVFSKKKNFENNNSPFTQTHSWYTLYGSIIYSKVLIEKKAFPDAVLRTFWIRKNIKIQGAKYQP